MASASDVARERIISHMNADHRDSVIRYCEHFGGFSSFSARNAIITDCQLDKLVIRVAGQEKRFYFTPPLSSFKEARERLVKWDLECVEALQKSDITLKEYRPPRGFHLLVFIVSLWTYIVLSREEHLHPGSWIFDYALKYIPWYTQIAERIRTPVFAMMILVHASEAVNMGFNRLTKHTVPMFGRLWWAWVMSNFVEGVGAYQRIDAIVKERRLEKEKRRH